MIDRREYQRRVEDLLTQIQDGTHDLRLLKVAGARGPALADRKLALAATREELAALVGSGTA